MKRLIVFLISMFLLMSCSSDNNDGNPVQTNQMEIKAFVIDPAVKSARVELQDELGVPVTVCGANDNQLCTRWSGEDGAASLFIAKDYDLSGHIAIAFGGVDTEFGYNLEGIEMVAELDLFSDIENIIISPAATLLYHLRQAGVADPEAALKAALGMTDVDLAGNPMDDAELLKASYLVMKVALMQNTADEDADAMSVIAEAIENAPGKLLADSDLLDLTALSADDKTAVAETADMLDNIPSGSTTAEVISVIAFSEKLQMYDRALAVVYDDYTSPHSGNYEANLEVLVEKIDALVEGGVPVDGFIISQLARFVVMSDDSIDTYAEIDALSESEFGGKLDTLAADADFVSSVSFLASEGVYMTTVPTTPLGLDDNDARVNYYFNSDADVNYIARKLASEIGWDSLSDNVTLNIIKKYTKYGFYQRAENYAKTYVFGSENRMKAYRFIGDNMLNYDPAKGFEYAQKSKKMFDDFAPTASTTADYTLLADGYTGIVNTYRKLGYTSEAQALFDWLIDLDNDIWKNLSASTLFTQYGRVISAQMKLVQEYIDNGQHAEALKVNDEYVIMIGKLPAHSSTYYVSHLMYYMYAMCYYMQLDDGSNSAALKSKTADLFNEMVRLKDVTLDSGSTSKTWQSYFAQAAGAVTWAKGQAYAKANILDVLTAVSSTHVGRAAYEIMIATSDGTFEDAKSIYEATTPLAADYSNLNSDRGYVQAFIYTSPTSPGFALNAVNNGNAAMANEALAYIRGILDDVVNKYTTEKTPLENRWPLVGYDNTKLDNGTAQTETGKYNGTYAKRYSYYGYLRVAHVYYLNNNITEAENTLEKAKAYIDTFKDSYIKSSNYAAIGYVYLQMGNATKAGDLFAAAAGVVMPADSIAKDYAIFYLGLVQDAIVTGDFSAAKTYLNSAKTHLPNIYTSSMGGNDDAAIIQTYLWKDTASRHFDMQENDEALATLKTAMEAARNISVEGDRKTQVGYIATIYGQNRAVEEGKAEIWEIYTTTADRKELAAKMIAAMIDNNDFGKSEIAFLDTDNDGKPDFFAPWATAQQIADEGLELDDDIDGDGITDDIDTMPYYKN